MDWNPWSSGTALGIDSTYIHIYIIIILMVSLSLSFSLSLFKASVFSSVEALIRG